MSSNGGQAPPLVRQGSLYNLTIEQLHNHVGDLGKPLGSMKLEELMKTVWTAEDSSNQVHQVVASSSSSSAVDPLTSISSPIQMIQRQPSLVFNQDLGHRTVDDVWTEIQQQEGRVSQDEERVERQPTLGEMTLEDFLVRAGVVNITPESLPQPIVAADALASRQPDWMQYQMNDVVLAPSSSLPMPGQHNLGGSYMPEFGPGVDLGNPVLDMSYVEETLGIPAPLIVAPLDLQRTEKKRTLPDDIKDKAMERRQKRMIKNRESAARSRARKQAYTSQLEGDVAQLKEVNAKIRKENEVDEMALSSIPQPRYQLRRTTSASF